MASWLLVSPYSRPLIGLLGLVFAFLLIRFAIRQVFALVKLGLVLALAAIVLFFYCDCTEYIGPLKVNADGETKGLDFSQNSEGEQLTHRQLCAQIVDAEDKDTFAERAILEGRAFKYFLNLISKTTRAQLLKDVNDRTTFENLTDEPDLHRAEPYAPGRGVILEASSADLGPEYGLPGWTVVPAIYVNTAHEIYALRILCAPGSKMYERLRKGITDDKLPVVNLVGLFFKNYARQPGDPKEQPWVKPIMVCPEVEFVESEEPREVMSELRDTGYARLLPTKRIDADAADERLVLDVTPSKDGLALRAWGADAGADIKTFVTDAVKKLKQRLPSAQADHAAAVVVTHGIVKDPQLKPVLDALKAAGAARFCVKMEMPKPNAATPGK